MVFFFLRYPNQFYSAIRQRARVFYEKFRLSLRETTRASSFIYLAEFARVSMTKNQYNLRLDKEKKKQNLETPTQS